MEPRLVSDMALKYLPGTEIRIQKIHLVIPEICNNFTVVTDADNNKWTHGVLLLNKLTTFVSIKLFYNENSNNKLYYWYFFIAPELCYKSTGYSSSAH